MYEKYCKLGNAFKNINNDRLILSIYKMQRECTKEKSESHHYLVLLWAGCQVCDEEPADKTPIKLISL